MDLAGEIKKWRADIHSDGYPMSIGELISLYQNNELDIHPEFQRLYRWTDTQKSRLIESLLLGIPIPSIFVSQRNDGVWDVIDGVQRLSTIFQTIGILKDEREKLVPPLVLTKTKYLPSLEGRTWEGKKSLGSEHQLLIKRSKIDIKIILRESSEASKYELFQRLNSGGSLLSDQEMRNVVLIMVSPPFYRWLMKLSRDENFNQCAALSDQALLEQYHVELAVRFLVFRNRSDKNLRGIGDIGDFLTEQIVALAESKQFHKSKEELIFKNTFAVLAESLGDDSFRKFDSNRDNYAGGFSISAFEVLAIGLGYHMGKDGLRPDPTQIVAVSKQLWNDPMFTKSSGSGVRASSRIPVIIPYGRKLLSQ
ncbi:MAG: DUF262 domain-containing protein [Dehalococcoidia bacterium]|nr:DUF262 domain-containing protein [Dehalococcoidia bacterium]